jgi:hypothetical protein
LPAILAPRFRQRTAGSPNSQLTIGRGLRLSARKICPAQWLQ